MHARHAVQCLAHLLQQQTEERQRRRHALAGTHGGLDARVIRGAEEQIVDKQRPSTAQLILLLPVLRHLLQKRVAAKTTRVNRSAGAAGNRHRTW